MAASYFGSHDVTLQLAHRQVPFLMLCKRDTELVPETGAAFTAGHVSEGHCIDKAYSLWVLKNPKVGGSKPPRVVLFLTNAVFDSNHTAHRGGCNLPAVMGAYQQLANKVDTANQMALQHRETGHSTSSSKATCAFLLRYAMVNMFTIARESGLVAKDKSLWDF